MSWNEVYTDTHINVYVYSVYTSAYVLPTTGIVNQLTLQNPDSYAAFDGGPQPEYSPSNFDFEWEENPCELMSLAGGSGAAHYNSVIAFLWGCR